MRHTLQMKLLIFGVICFLLTVGCGIVQLLQFRTITQSSERVAQYDVAIDDSSRLREEVIRLVARVKDIWLRGGKTDSVDSIVDTAEQSWQLIDTLRARVNTDLNLTPPMRDQLQQYDDSMADYRTSYLQTLARFRVELAQPDAANADTRADAALRGKGLAASGLIGGFQDELHQATAQARAGREASVATARTVTLGEAALLLVMIVSAGLWLVRTIGRGVGDVVVAAAALGSGARDVQVPIRGGGELAQLGHSLMRWCSNSTRRGSNSKNCGESRSPSPAPPPSTKFARSSSTGSRRLSATTMSRSTSFARMIPRTSC